MRYFCSDGSEFEGVPSVLEGIRVTYHYDDHGDEWVVRIHHPKGMQSVCGCPGEDEARLVAASLATVVAIADCTFTETIVGDCDSVACNNLIEYDAMKDTASKAIGLVQEFIA